MSEEKEERRSRFAYDDKKDIVQILLYMDKDVATNLGALVMAQDYVKNIYMQKGMKKAQQNGIIVPGENGKGTLHAV